jgi:hypothetical protein
MFFEEANLLPAGCIPKSRIVSVSGEHEAAIRGEGHGGNPVCMPNEGANPLPAGRVPPPRRLVPTSGKQEAAILGEGHGADYACRPQLRHQPHMLLGLR